MQRLYSLWPRWIIALGIALLAALLRIPAWQQLPYDIDERVYVPIAERYAAALEAGDSVALRDPLGNIEHPPLAKLLSAAAIAIPPGQAPQGAPGFEDTSGLQPTSLPAARFPALAASVLLAALLALWSPAAGVVFALSSWQIKYGVVAYLEAVPGLLAALAILLLDRWWRLDETATPKDRWRLLAGSAALIGLAAAAKYPYALVAAPTLGALVLVRWSTPSGGWRGALAAAGIALGCFYVANPLAWADPLGYVRETVAFHFAYSGNDLVQSQQFSPIHNLRLLFKPMPYDPFFPFSLLNTLRLEPVLTTLGLLALPILWRRSPPLGLWLLLNIVFLILWPTKWSHYTLQVIPGLALSAGVAIEAAVSTIARMVKDRRNRRSPAAH